MTLNVTGLSGAVLQMFSHGVIAGLLFAVVGRMVYDRAHTRELDRLESMRLANALPFAAVTFVIASVASMGLPGFSGFVAELQVILGAWTAFPMLAVLTGLGILIGVAYTLRALQKAFFGDAPGEPPRIVGAEVTRPNDGVDRTARLLTSAPTALLAAQQFKGVKIVPHEPVDPITVPERLGAVLLIASSLVIGLYPRLLLDLIVPGLKSGLFDGVWRVAGP
jgi:NADH-quinone oxidoreductase subunit M